MLVEIVYIPPALLAMRNALTEIFKLPQNEAMKDLIDKLDKKA